MKSSLLDLRWLLLVSILFLSFGYQANAAGVPTGKGTPQTELNYQNAYETAKDAGGMNVLFLLFAVAMTVCLLIGFILAIVCVITFMRTNEWAKIQNMAVGVGFLFAFGGLFFYLMGVANDPSPLGS